MNTSLTSLLSDLMRSKCWAVLASSALAGVLYLKTRRHYAAGESDNFMRTFVRNSENVLEMIRESSFSSDIDLSSLSEYQDMSVDSSDETHNEMYDCPYDESILHCPPLSTDLWRLTDISVKDCSRAQSDQFSDYGSIDAEEEEMSYVWDLDISLAEKHWKIISI